MVPLSATEQEEALMSMGIAFDSKLCAVLGRLFKVHPSFDEAMAGVLIDSPWNTVLVLVAEKIGEWNEVIYKRLQERVTATLLSRMLSMQEKKLTDLNLIEPNGVPLDVSEQAVAAMSKLRFVSYSFYGKLVQLATVVLDTYPYGGEFCYASTHYFYLSDFTLICLNV